MKKIHISIAMIMISYSAFAGGITYTPQELNNMVNSGQYPEQGAVANTQTRDLSYSACKIAIESVMSQLRGTYPVKTIVNTSMLYIVKAWANDGAITASCSQPDRKMVLTRALYR